LIIFTRGLYPTVPHPEPMIRTVFFVLLFSLRSLGVLAQHDDCDLKKDKDGIKVYTCRSDTSKFRSLRADFTLENTSFEVIQKILFDPLNYVNWQYNVIEAEILEKSADNQLIYRLVIHAPWPVQNREMIVRISSEKESDQRMSFTMHTINHSYPLNDDYIRVPFSQGSWQVQLVDSNLHVQYLLNIDPGGSIPSFLVNMAMAEGPYHSFSNLKRMLKSE